VPCGINKKKGKLQFLFWGGSFQRRLCMVLFSKGETFLKRAYSIFTLFCGRFLSFVTAFKLLYPRTFTSNKGIVEGTWWGRFREYFEGFPPVVLFLEKTLFFHWDLNGRGDGLKKINRLIFFQLPKV